MFSREASYLSMVTVTPDSRPKPETPETTLCTAEGPLEHRRQNRGLSGLQNLSLLLRLIGALC